MHIHVDLVVDVYKRAKRDSKNKKRIVEGNKKHTTSLWRKQVALSKAMWWETQQPNHWT